MAPDRRRSRVHVKDPFEHSRTAAAALRGGSTDNGRFHQMRPWVAVTSSLSPDGKYRTPQRSTTCPADRTSRRQGPHGKDAAAT